MKSVRLRRPTRLILGLAGSVLIATCSGNQSPDQPSRPRQQRRPSLTVAAIDLLPNGVIANQVQITNLPVLPTRAGGTLLAFHPAADATVTVQVKSAPPGGRLVACAADMDGRKNHNGCTSIRPGPAIPTTIHGGGGTHLALILEGTWPAVVSLDQVDIFYDAADNFVRVEFPAQ